MVLASREMINTSSAEGYRGETTLNHIFKGFVKKNPREACSIDPLDRKVLTGIQPERL